MSRPSFLRPAPLATLAVILMILGCSDMALSGGGGFNEGGFGFGGTIGTGGVLDPPEGGGKPGAFDYSHLCGIGAESCTPSYLRPTCSPSPSDGGAAGLGGGGFGGSGGDGEQGGEGPGGLGGSGTGSPEALYGCQVMEENGNPSATCAVSGDANVGAVCNSSADCNGGLGCVLSSAGNEGGGSPAPAVGLCRPYCCGDLEACPPDTFCAPLPLFDSTARLDDPSTAIEVPVCTPIIDCQLLGDSCDEGQTCSIVRTDGSTSCVPIGAGGLCQACPCAEGYVCSFSSGTCQKLCDTNMNDCPGEGAICQGGSVLGDVGLCVLGDSACD